MILNKYSTGFNAGDTGYWWQLTMIWQRKFRNYIYAKKYVTQYSIKVLTLENFGVPCYQIMHCQLYRIHLIVQRTLEIVDLDTVDALVLVDKLCWPISCMKCTSLMAKWIFCFLQTSPIYQVSVTVCLI